MRIRSYLLRFTFALTTFIVGAVCYSYCAYYSGKIEAHFNALREKYSIRAYGTQDGAIVEYKQILSNEYGVEIIPVAGCIVSQELREKTIGYNESMEAAIEKRYGQGVLERSWRRARGEYQKRRNMAVSSVPAQAQ
jgi:hypothetical protein